MRYLRHHPTSDMLWRTIAPSLHHCDWLFPLLALKTSSGTGSTYKSTWGRVDSKGLYGTWRLQVWVFSEFLCPILYDFFFDLLSDFLFDFLSYFQSDFCPISCLILCPFFLFSQWNVGSALMFRNKVHVSVARVTVAYQEWVGEVSQKQILPVKR